jgi:hypothetical protein
MIKLIVRKEKKKIKIKNNNMTVAVYWQDLLCSLVIQLDLLLLLCGCDA